MAITHLTTENFDEAIAQGVTLVDFWADWCGPCRMLAPVLEQLDAESGGKYQVAKVHVDQEPTLATRFEVMNIPTVILFRDGEELDRRVGIHPAQEFAGMLSQV
ncbi:MAG: thioredoxin [Oscillospiraceae bacterium]|nr:thioredoxin [Oscillospiraceae bacterium]